MDCASYLAWVSGEVVTASIGNTHWRDNLRYLKGLDGAVTIEDDLTVDNLITSGNVDGVDVSAHKAGTAVGQHTGGAGDHTHQSTGAQGGKIDHGAALDGLGDDDHTQYQKSNLLTTAGDIAYATGASTWARLALGTQGYVLRAGASAPEYALVQAANLEYKASDETVNDSDTLQNDDDLYFSIGASAIWLIQLFLRLSTGTTPRFKFAFTVPSGCTGYRSGTFGVDSGASQLFTVADLTTAQIIDDDMLLAIIWAIVINSTNAGTVQLQWAQATANASDTKVLAGSCMMRHQLA